MKYIITYIALRLATTSTISPTSSLPMAPPAMSAITEATVSRQRMKKIAM